jgi:hypothetical protein
MPACDRLGDDSPPECLGPLQGTTASWREDQWRPTAIGLIGGAPQQLGVVSLRG